MHIWFAFAVLTRNPGGGQDNPNGQYDGDCVLDD